MPPSLPTWLGTFAIGLVACAPPPDLGGSGDVDPLDPTRLDRTANNLDGEGCGYPSGGAPGYGTGVGTRMDNFVLEDCDGEPVELADYLCDDAGNPTRRAILVNIGAGWCEPCIEETRGLLPELHAELRDQGVEFVQVLFQDWDAQLPTSAFCDEWRSGDWRAGPPMVDLGFELPFPVLVDQTNDWRSIYMKDPQAATPVNLLIDANANIRWKLEGQEPEDLRAQIERVIAEPYGD